MLLYSLQAVTFLMFSVRLLIIYGMPLSGECLSCWLLGCLSQFDIVNVKNFILFLSLTGFSSLEVLLSLSSVTLLCLLSLTAKWYLPIALSVERTFSIQCIKVKEHKFKSHTRHSRLWQCQARLKTS